jgi:multidrug efflux pump subunit AcrB
VITNLITAINSNQMIKPSIWIDPISGDDYYLTVQYFDKEIESLEALRDIPVTRRLDPAALYTDVDAKSSDIGHEQSVTLRDVASIRRMAYPSEADHYNIQRVVDLLVSPRTSELGGTLAAVKRVVARLRSPANIKVYYRGSVEIMRQAFSSFKSGFALAIVVVYLVGVAQASSWLNRLFFSSRSQWA